MAAPKNHTSTVTTLNRVVVNTSRNLRSTAVAAWSIAKSSGEGVGSLGCQWVMVGTIYPSGEGRRIRSC